MASTKEKLEEKLHLGGHKKEDPVAHPTPAATGLNEPGAPHAGQHKEGTMEKVKNKVKGGKKGDAGGSSSSSESDGEGGRRKKKVGPV
ncbi:hypothetical protein L7F22_009422 [Adiantum nelumboides]|nr:hypothetical protein [Adiantum nelumboides]